MGALTRIFCAALEEQQRASRASACRASASAGARSTASSSRATASTSAIPACSSASRADARDLPPGAGARARPAPAGAGRRSPTISQIDQKVREDPTNRLFLDMLCSRKDPALTLTRMNETGLLGRLPDFGRIVAQMQHNLYHVYTVDEHTIRRSASCRRSRTAARRRAADLDRGDAQAALAARALRRACTTSPRAVRRPQRARRGRRQAPAPPGLPDDATETVAWLVRHHLVMSRFAFKRDSEDPQTVRTSSPSCSRRSG